MPNLDEAEEPGETAAIISAHQVQPASVLHFNSNANAITGSIPRRRINRRSSGRNSLERIMSTKRRRTFLKSDGQQSRIGTAGLAASSFLLAAVCAAHLIRTTTFDLKNKNDEYYFTSDDIQQQQQPPQFGSLSSNIFTSQQHYNNFDIQNKISQNVNNRLQRLTEFLENYIPSTITSSSLNDWTLFRFGERHEVQVNVLLAERRRRNIQRQRSPTPIPTTQISRSFQRQSSAPPDSLRNWTTTTRLSTSSPLSITQPSTSDFSFSNYSTQNNNNIQSDEPTLMDYDAIDSYWRWDIDQEKGGILPHQSINDFGGGYSQHVQQYYDVNDYNSYNDRYSEPEDFLYERDIQLLTEKALLPDEQINYLDLNSDEANLLANFSRTLSFDGIIEYQNNNSKWNDLLQLPTSSLLASSAGQDGKSSSIRSPSFDNQIEDEILSNIPISSPPYFENAENEFKQHKNNCLLIKQENDNFIECSSSSHQNNSFSPLLLQNDIQQPILFNDVSLVATTRCSSSLDSISIEEEDNGNDNNAEKLMERQHMFGEQQQNSQLIKKEIKKEEENKSTEEITNLEAKEEAETEMILSALFPQFFSPLPFNNNNGTSATSPQQQILNSSSLSSLVSDGSGINNTEIEAILHDLAAAETILMNNTLSLTQNNLLLNQQLIQQQSIGGLSSTTIHTPLPLSPTTIGPLSPIFEHFNQTLNMNGSPPSLPFDTNTNSFNLFAGPLNIYCNNNTVQNSCSPTTSSSSVGLPTTDTNSIQINSPKQDYSNNAIQSSELSDTANSFAFRYDQKLVPKNTGAFRPPKNPSTKNIDGHIPMKAKSKRGRRSKDDSLVNQYDLPYSAEDLTAMSYRDYSSLMQDTRLNNDQKALIKKIRRRGRNKLAARKCRERRLNNRFDGDIIYDEYIEDEWDEDVDVVDINDYTDNSINFNNRENQLGEEEFNSKNVSRFQSTSAYAANINSNQFLHQNNIINNNSNSRQRSPRKQQHPSTQQYAIRVEI